MSNLATRAEMPGSHHICLSSPASLYMMKRFMRAVHFMIEIAAGRVRETLANIKCPWVRNSLPHRDR